MHMCVRTLIFSHLQQRVRLLSEMAKWGKVGKEGNEGETEEAKRKDEMLLR